MKEFWDRLIESYTDIMMQKNEENLNRCVYRVGVYSNLDPEGTMDEYYAEIEK